VAKSGTAHYVASGEHDAFDYVRDLLSYLPPNNYFVGEPQRQLLCTGFGFARHARPMSQHYHTDAVLLHHLHHRPRGALTEWRRATSAASSRRIVTRSSASTGTPSASYRSTTSRASATSAGRYTPRPS
jgi:hypothetical protein